MELKMNREIDTHLKYLGLNNLRQQWDAYLKEATLKKCSYQKLLTTIISDEYRHVFDRRRSSRLKAACIPEMLVMETFPFQRQSQLKKKTVLELYDSLRYITESQVLLFIGPTGCGKTGLATSYLIHAIDNEYHARFIDFKNLLRQLYASLADHTDKKVLKRFATIDCLLIDEVGYTSLDKMQAGLFFDLMKMRHKKHCTIITSQLGFDEWDSFVNDRHLTAAILDRITENCTVFNMSKCISIRRKRIEYAADKGKSE